MVTRPMQDKRYILSFDQGTTSSRALLFDAEARLCGMAQRELPQIYPQEGWVEHDPEAIWRDTRDVGREVLRTAGVQASEVAAIGIANQRETTLLWDRQTGTPLYHAIVWQDRRTADYCAALRGDGREEIVRERAGLLLDPYFSASKLKWLLDNVPDARGRAKRGELAFGTIDSWLIWKLTGGAAHLTDVSNASRTSLFNLAHRKWDDQLLYLFGIPRQLLPGLRDCQGDFGVCDAAHFGAAIPITGVAGDQQAATVGQACFQPGMLKSTYGTGCFAMMHTGDKAVASQHRLLSTIAYQRAGTPSYALEGSIFMAGATVQWLRDQARFIGHAEESAGLAAAAAPDSQVYLVPGFAGLGAPYWDPHARGAILGMTRDTGIAEIVRAGLESVAYQTRDLLQAMAQDAGTLPDRLRVDGGMSANDWAMQFLADMTGLVVERPEIIETTALGAAYLAGLEVGLYPSLDMLADNWRCERRFVPQMSADQRDSKYRGWKAAVARVLTDG